MVCADSEIYELTLQVGFAPTDLGGDPGLEATPQKKGRAGEPGPALSP